MPKTKLINLFRGGFSTEVPTFNSNGTDIDVSKFLKINIDVPTESGETTPANPTITFAEFQQMMMNGTFVENTVYEIQV